MKKKKYYYFLIKLNPKLKSQESMKYIQVVRSAKDKVLKQVALESLLDTYYEKDIKDSVVESIKECFKRDGEVKVSKSVTIIPTAYKISKQEYIFLKKVLD